MRMSKIEVIEIKNNAINHFKENVRRELEKKSIKNAGASNG